MGRLETLVDFLRYTKRSAGLNIIVSGLSLPSDLAKEDALLPHVWHVNPFCLFVKSNRQRWDQCLCAKEVLLHTLQVRQGPVCGCCPFGVWEKSWPIRFHDQVVGAVSASTYQGEMSHVQALWQRTLPPEEHLQAEKLYRKHMKQQKELQASAECTCQLISDYLTQLGILGEITFVVKADPTDQLIHRAMDYLRIHLHEPVTIRDVARFCSISESYLQHLFHRRRQQSIVQTLTSLRMDRAVQILSHSQRSIAETAAACGFSDPNYFSIVFSKRMGMSPKQYRLHRQTIHHADDDRKAGGFETTITAQG